MICKVVGCSKPARIRGWCSMHHSRFLRNGDPLLSGGTPKGACRAFLREATAYRGTDCRFWPFAHNDAGYGHLTIDGKRVYAHRLICEAINGPPDEGCYTAHSCGNGHLGCITPAHLRWATPKENTADAIRHGRVARGDQHWTRRGASSDPR